MFFERWWRHQTEEKKEKFREVVKEGRVEFVGGGWTMNDEACTYYEDIIDQIQLGHEFIQKEFNIKPKVAWQLDPFGKKNKKKTFLKSRITKFLFVDTKSKQKLRNRKIKFLKFEKVIAALKIVYCFKWALHRFSW